MYSWRVHRPAAGRDKAGPFLNAEHIYASWDGRCRGRVKAVKELEDERKEIDKTKGEKLYLRKCSGQFNKGRRSVPAGRFSVTAVICV